MKFSKDDSELVRSDNDVIKKSGFLHTSNQVPLESIYPDKTSGNALKINSEDTTQPQVRKRIGVENIIIDYHTGAKWEDVIFLFPNVNETISRDSRIGVKYKGDSRYKYFDFKELKLIKKNGKPKLHWTILSSFVLDEEIKKKLKGRTAKGIKLSTRIARLRNYLNELTGIDEDPFLPFNTTDLWKPKFRYRFDNSEEIQLQNARTKYETKNRSKKI